MIVKLTSKRQVTFPARVLEVLGVESLADRPPAGCGLLDRLIAIDHDEAGLRTLTLDRRMARLPGAELLS